MEKKFKRALFIFRRDLRLVDNTGLNLARKSAAEVVPVFIFDPRQIDQNPYRGNNSVQFMLETLSELTRDLEAESGKLFLLYGIAEEVVPLLVKSLALDAVFFNRDYTPFSTKRDQKISSHCRQLGVHCQTSDDALLNAPGTILNGSGNPYYVFTPFMRRAKTTKVSPPAPLASGKWFRGELKDSDPRLLTKKWISSNSEIFCHGGRTVGLNLLKTIADRSDYERERNLPALHGTTGLGAHNKFGTVSIREVYATIANELGDNHLLNNQLYWRDFFYHVVSHYPSVFGKPFNQRFSKIRWSNSKVKFDAWCEGQTGFPIVDAGIRQLNRTGFMHNRVRMIVASFLTKDLHIDWRWGEKYFATKLVDYDPAVNNGNWQWAASTGCDAQPYFRIFNPWLQQKKFDPECEYIKRWLPELEKLAPKEIHLLFDQPRALPGYSKPIVDHADAKLKALEIYSAD